MKSTFHCPACSHLLQKQFAPAKSAKNPQPYVIVFCGNSSCSCAEAANNGGSGETEQEAYRSLCLAVQHAEDQMTERECELLSPEDQKDKNAWAKSERQNEQKGCL